MNRITQIFFLLTVAVIAQPGLSQDKVAGKPAKNAAAGPTTQPKFRIGKITSPRIPESSGVVASRKYPGVFWTHNDSGNPPAIFAIRRDGTFIREFPIQARNRDWEDIAIDNDGHLFVGEIGNNGGQFNQLAVYKIDEPDPTSPVSALESGPDAAAKPLPILQTWTLRFPGKPFDCESLFVWKDYGYVISKLFNFEPAGLYRFKMDANDKPITLEHIADLPIRYPCTAADISTDGKRLAVLSVGGPYLFHIDGLLDSPTTTPLTTLAPALARITPKYYPFFQIQEEGICITEDGLLVTAETRDVFFFSWEMMNETK